MEGNGKMEDTPPAYGTEHNANYGQPTAAYGQPNNAYGQPNNAYGQPNNAYGQPNNAYGQPTGAYPATQFSPYGYQGPAAPVQQNQSNYSNAVVVTQPMPTTLLTTTVPDNMALAIFATFCCFLPLGIFAIMKASDSRSQLARGDISGAVISANESRRFSLISVGIGIAVIIGIIIAVVVIVVNSTTTTYYYG